MTTPAAPLNDRDRLLEDFRKELKDKLAVASVCAENLHGRIVLKQCEDFLVEQFAAGLDPYRSLLLTLVIAWDADQDTELDETLQAARARLGLKLRDDLC